MQSFIENAEVRHLSHRCRTFASNGVMADLLGEAEFWKDATHEDVLLIAATLAAPAEQHQANSPVVVAGVVRLS